MFLAFRRFFVLLLVLSVAAACTSEEKPRNVTGSRMPDDQGTVTDVNLERIQIDGKRSYTISKAVESFSTYDKKIIIPLLSWKSKYVHLGIEDDEVVWIAGIGLLETTESGTKVNYTSGVLTKVDDKRRAFMKDGTVFKLGPGVKPPAIGSRVRAEIDPSKDLVSVMVVQ